jgi:hypothetical protein
VRASKCHIVSVLLEPGRIRTSCFEDEERGVGCGLKAPDAGGTHVLGTVAGSRGRYRLADGAGSDSVTGNRNRRLCGAWGHV